IMRRLVMNDFYDDPTEAEALIEKRLSIIRNATKGYEVRTKDGLILIGEVHRTADQGYLISLQDITEQRRAEEQALSKLTDTVQALDTGLILLDRDLKFVFGNERLMQIFHQEIAAPEVGEPMEEIALRLAEGGVFELPDGVSPERSVKRTMRLITNMERNVLVFIEGGRVFRCSVYPTKDDGRVIDFTDVTDQRQAEAELQRQREAAHQNEKLSAMGELLAGVAHELNNPLSIVVGYAMMMQNSVSDPKLRRQVDNVAQAAERCSRIVKAFLAMARQRPAELKRCSLNELMMAAVDMMGHRLRGAGIEVTMDLDPDLPDVEADEDQIIQVFTNLLVNAEQAVADRPEPRTLHLRSFMDHRAGKAVARIADNGPGIAKDVMPRIFEPFYTTKDVGTGTGIGLAFCHRVVTSHGGRMTVRSEPGRGARFYVRLALCEQQDDGPTIPAMSQNPGFGTVLVVDDEAGVAQLIGDVLGEAGYHVQIKNSAFDALELLKTQRFEAIISDIKMPGMDGPAFFEAITAIDPAMARRVGFVTGDTLSKSVAAFLSATEQPHLEKPVTPTELLGLVAGLVNIRSH
ncbi:MAG: ATP-binding protein, partial [Pseudomonadota bacterium]